MEQNKNRKTCITCNTCNTFYTFGFTLIELIVSIGILMVIFGIVTINISPIPSNTLQSTSKDMLINDIRSQQTLSMANDSSYGIYLEADRYSLFKGGSYVEGSSGNFAINLDSGITLTNITLPNSVIVFAPGSGDIVGYTAGSDSFTLGSTVTSKSSVIKINKYGATY